MSISSEPNPDIFRRIKHRLSGATGAIDLASIMVGVLVIGIVGGVIAATVFAVIPWSQNEAAKQGLSAVQTAEGVHYALSADTGVSTYADMASLVAQKLIQPSDSMKVGINANGTCYAAVSESDTGSAFWVDSYSPNIREYIASSVSSCLDLSLLAAAPDGDETPGVELKTVRTFAGSTGGYLDGPALSAQFEMVGGVTVGPSGDVFVSEYNRVRKINPAGVVSTFATIAGVGAATIDPAGNVYVGTYTNDGVNASVYIHKITPAGVVSTLAGGPEAGWGEPVFATGTSARFEQIASMTFDPASNALYVASERYISKVSASGTHSPFVGDRANGEFDYANGNGSAAKFSGIDDISVDTSGNVLIVDSGILRKATPTGDVSVLAGMYDVYEVIDGPALEAGFDRLQAVTVSPSGDIYMVDGSIIRMLSNGTVSTLAGTGVRGVVNGPIAEAQFDRPRSIAAGPDGKLYLNDQFSPLIRVIE